MGVPGDTLIKWKNPKSEIRNPKYLTHAAREFVLRPLWESGFGFRISDLTSVRLNEKLSKKKAAGVSWIRGDDALTPL
jgi:hypothetical protein